MAARFAQTTINAEITKATDMAVLISVGDDDLIVADWWLEKEGLL